MSSIILSKSWFPVKAVTAMYRKSPYNTGVGIYDNTGKISSDKPIRMLENIHVRRVSLTFTMLK